MAIPLLAGLAIRSVASYAKKHGIPAAKKAYASYIKTKKLKNTANITETFKNKSILDAGKEFKTKNFYTKMKEIRKKGKQDIANIDKQLDKMKIFSKSQKHTNLINKRKEIKKQTRQNLANINKRLDKLDPIPNFKR
jgi:predicted metalloendopeptidase